MIYFQVKKLSWYESGILAHIPMNTHINIENVTSNSCHVKPIEIIMPSISTHVIHV